MTVKEILTEFCVLPITTVNNMPIRYRERAEWLGRKIYQRKSPTLHEKEFWGTVIGFLAIMIVLLLGAIAIAIFFPNAS